MLVLSRKSGETIHIGAEITLTVVQIQGGRVKIAIDAPERIRILRGELKDSFPEFRLGGRPVLLAAQ